MLRITSKLFLILDIDIRSHVDQELECGKLWPEALILLSPAYQQAETVADLVESDVLHPACAQIFRVDDQPLRLYRHQRRAIDLAARLQPFVVTTGTGSGKSLTYIVPS